MLVRTSKTSDVNRATFFMNGGEYAFNSIYYSNPQEIPNPILSSDFNSNLYFLSTTPGEVTVNWGDGNIETIPLQHSSNGYYIIGWRCLDVDYRKNPDSVGGGWGYGTDTATGQYIRPLPNHHYTDGSTEERHIVFTFTTENISNFMTSTIKMWGFPILELPNLTSLTITHTVYIHEIPFTRVSKLKKLTNLDFNSLGVKMEYIPDSILSMTNLTNLGISGVFNLADPDASNLRKISGLKNLTTLTAWMCNIQTYVKEFNDLNNLQNLIISNANASIDTTPTFNEVSQINQNMTSFNFMGSEYSGGGKRKTWLSEEITGKGLSHLTNLSIGYQNNLTLDLPEYLKEMNSLKSIYGLNSFLSQIRADTFVNNFYDYITGWDQITMTDKLVNGLRNQFYNLSITMYASSYPNDYRPSGIEQPTAGFVKGVSNGTPTTPMEKIYVLKNNYQQYWYINPS